MMISAPSRASRQRLASESNASSRSSPKETTSSVLSGSAGPAGSIERRVLREDPPLELAQRLRRLDAELLDERSRVRR